MGLQVCISIQVFFLNGLMYTNSLVICFKVWTGFLAKLQNTNSINSHFFAWHICRSPLLSRRSLVFGLNPSKWNLRAVFFSIELQQEYDISSLILRLDTSSLVRALNGWSSQITEGIYSSWTFLERSLKSWNIMFLSIDRSRHWSIDFAASRCSCSHSQACPAVWWLRVDNFVVWKNPKIFFVRYLNVKYICYFLVQRWPISQVPLVRGSWGAQKCKRCGCHGGLGEQRSKNAFGTEGLQKWLTTWWIGWTSNILALRDNSFRGVPWRVPRIVGCLIGLGSSMEGFSLPLSYV